MKKLSSNKKANDTLGWLLSVNWVDTRKLFVREPRTRPTSSTWKFVRSCWLKSWIVGEIAGERERESKNKPIKHLNLPVYCYRRWQKHPVTKICEQNELLFQIPFFTPHRKKPRPSITQLREIWYNPFFSSGTLYKSELSVFPRLLPFSRPSPQTSGVCALFFFWPAISP